MTTNPYPPPPCITCGRPRVRPDEPLFPGAARPGGVNECEACVTRAARRRDTSPHLREALTAPAWTEQALCAQVDPELFFPEKGGSAGDAQRVCHQCPVRAECLEAALERNESHGIWGGLSSRERRHLLVLTRKQAS